MKYIIPVDSEELNAAIILKGITNVLLVRTHTSSPSKS